MDRLFTVSRFHVHEAGIQLPAITTLLPLVPPTTSSTTKFSGKRNKISLPPRIKYSLDGDTTTDAKSSMTTGGGTEKDGLSDYSSAESVSSSCPAVPPPVVDHLQTKELLATIRSPPTTANPPVSLPPAVRPPQHQPPTKYAATTPVTPVTSNIAAVPKVISVISQAIASATSFICFVHLPILLLHHC
jgi:hypothetical protein